MDFNVILSYARKIRKFSPRLAPCHGQNSSHNCTVLINRYYHQNGPPCENGWRRRVSWRISPFFLEGKVEGLWGEEPRVRPKVNKVRKFGGE